MITVNAVLLLMAFLLVLMEAIGFCTPRVKLGWLGLACWLLAVLLGSHLR